MPEDYNKKVDTFKEAHKKEAEDTVNRIFPQKVVDLDILLKSDNFSLKRLTSIEDKLNIPIPDALVLDGCDEPKLKRQKTDGNSVAPVPGSKVMLLPNGVARSNKHIVELIDILKPHIVELIEHANMIKMWIAYMIPRIEDGNNFGVSIQEDILAEARQVESDSATYLDQISRYYMTRGKVLSKVAKYPHLEDMRRTVSELDEKEFISLRLVICELRNHYASLHDIIHKNKDKILKPRNSNTEAMY